MIGSFFKKIGLSIAMLCSSVSSVFHKPKSINNKPQEPVKIEQMVDLKETTSEQSIIFYDPIIEESVIKEIEDPIEKTHEEIIADINAEINRKKEEKRSLKEKLRKLEEKKIMDYINDRISKSPKNPETWNVAAVCFLTDDQVRAILPESIDIKSCKSFDDPNDIFV